MAKDKLDLRKDSGAVTEATTPISKLKSPMPLDFVKGVWKKFSQAQLMTGEVDRW